MKRIALLLVAAAAPLAAQGTFEGAVAIRVASERGDRNLNYLVKDGKMRMDQPGQRGETVGMIVDPATKKMQMLMGSQKMYMEMELKPPAENTKRTGGEHKIERTGKSERIAGYTCEHVLVTDEDGSQVDACVTMELGSFRLPMGGGPMQQPREPGWSGGLAPGAFPLKVMKGDKAIFEVTGIERKALDAALFVPPSDFKKFEMPSFKRP